MYWLIRGEEGESILMAYLPQDEIWEGGMPGEWLDKLSFDTFKKSSGDKAVSLSFPQASSTAELKRMVEDNRVEFLVISLTRRACFSTSWWRPLVSALKEGGALALPMGPSFPPSQGLPVAYWTPNDLEEIGKDWSHERREVQGEFNPLIGALPASSLQGLRDELPLADILKTVAKGGRTVAAGGLVHFFADFYGSSREDMLKFITFAPKRVLDVGCAKGEFGRLLKNRFGCEVWGIEILEESASKAARVLDRVEVMDVELDTPNWNRIFDLVVLGDILEHLRDPWGFLRKVRGWLIEKGRVIVSVPNTGFYPIIRAMLQGRFDYVPVGLLCVEHLRFFTEATLREMFEEAGFEVLVQEPQLAPLPQKYEDELKRLAGILPGVDESCLRSPGYYVVATPRE